ncbi:type IV pilin-like G/H family protein [Microcoleus sp. AT8-B4]|uniref:type IV pilin-like G/H family protein n=1 Tax=Microcoleus sp. AT8-B4 TaxID=2818620 RepID=UPI002FD5547B
MSQQYSQSNSSAYNGCGCLVLVIFVGIIVATALPDLLHRGNRSPLSEAKQSVSSLTKSQQVHFLEKGAFTNSIDALKAVSVSIKTETANYKYSIRATEKVAFTYGVSKQKEFKSYVGGVFVFPAKKVDANAAKNETTTIFILCEADAQGTIKPAEPIYQNGQVACANGTRDLKK